MNFKIETIPNYRIAYFRRIGPYGQENVELMEKLKEWAKRKNLLKSAILLAIPQDNPETTLPKKCMFDACIVISRNYKLDHSIAESEIPGGEYVIFEVRHTAEAIQKAYSEIFLSLQNHGYQIDQKPIMERYFGDQINHPYCEICVPVKPLLIENIIS